MLVGRLAVSGVVEVSVVQVLWVSELRWCRF